MTIEQFGLLLMVITAPTTGIFLGFLDRRGLIGIHWSHVAIPAFLFFCIGELLFAPMVIVGDNFMAYFGYVLLTTILGFGIVILTSSFSYEFFNRRLARRYGET